MRLQVDLLKEATRYYVIDHPRVVSIREGQKEMLRKLFEIYTEVLGLFGYKGGVTGAGTGRLNRLFGNEGGVEDGQVL